MRIGYFAHVNGAAHSGVVHKMAGQIGQWRVHGHEVRAFIATRDDDGPWRSLFPGALVRRYESPASRMRAMTALVRHLRRFAPAITYLRWDLFYPQMLWFPSSTPLVVEVNSDDLAEYRLGSRLRSFYNARTRDLALARARALVFVTSELSDNRSFRHLRARHTVITNGIDLRAYPELPAPSNERPRLAFVGTASQPWHGIDKLVTLAYLRPDWRFDIVGSRDDDRTSPPNMTWHGPLDRAGVIDVLARADVGVGTLALHRKSMDESCSLKVREYLAVGLPTIYGGRDPDADVLGSCTLRIPNTETNVLDDLARIDGFVARSRGLRVPRAAVAHIDVSRKEQQRLGLFEDLVVR